MISHQRIRVVDRKVEEVPIKQGVYSTHTKKNGWTDVRIIELPPSCVIDSEYVYDKGMDVSQIYESHFSNREGDFLLFNASFVGSSGQILGKTIVDEKVFAPDIDGKTENRRHLYWQDGEFRVGRIENPVGKGWGVQGTPSIKAMGDDALDLSMRIENTPSDIAGVNPHTVAGLKDNRSLLMLFVDGRGSVDAGLSVKDCMCVLMEYGCTSFINLDGGHSSTLVTSSTAIQSRLGMVIPTHICDTRYTQPRKVHHAVALKLDVHKLLKGDDQDMPYNNWDQVRITSPYGMRWLKGEHVMHHGIDLATFRGDTVPAFWGGKVVYAGETHLNTGLGNMGITVIVEDDNDCYQLYAHLDVTKVSVGDVIKRGDPIGFMGNTGASYGAHLHYEIRTKGDSWGWRLTLEPTKYLEMLFKIKELKEKQPPDLDFCEVEYQGSREKGLLYEGRSYIPVRWFTEQFPNLGVAWDKAKKLARIYTK